MKYIVRGRVTISMSTVVEAPERKAALEIARDRPNCDLGRMTQTKNEAWCHSGELDGIVDITECAPI